MTNKEKKDWLAVKYPLTVIRDRYEGTYSGAMWLAFPLGYDEVPEDVDGEDSECMYFWENYQEPVGKGAYANDAVVDLIEQMREFEPEECNELINFLRSPFIKENLTDEKVAPWIAYLEKQKEQKPAEWSEEDEDMLNSCISSIEEAKENRYAYKETDGDTSYDREINWLKSLRPSWKPSEEQMEALKKVAYYSPGTDENLIRLYQDLKKL